MTQPTNQDNERPRFAYLHHGVRQELGISWTEYILLDMVYHLSAKYGYCYMTVSSLSEYLGMSFNGTKDIIRRMIDRELLVQEARGLVCGSAYLEIAYLEKDGAPNKIAKIAKPIKKPLRKSQPVAKTALRLRKLQSIAKTSDNININNNNILTKKSTNVLLGDSAEKPQPKVPSKDINDLFKYWEDTTGVPISSRVKQNRNACSNLLKRYHNDKHKVEQLIQGVAAAHQDQYAPRIADFSDLQSKLTQLLVWGKGRVKSHERQQSAII